jgi:ASC-1-like (ASCH) protein
MLHKMKLKPKPFEKIKSGEKTIEIRLFDEKRQKLAIGDNIKFINIENREEIVAEVIDLLKYKTFR